MEMKDVKVEDPKHSSGNTVATTDSGDKKLTNEDPDTDNDEKTAIDVYMDKLHELKEQYNRQLIYGRNVALLAGYFVYFGFAMYHHNGSEDWWRLVWITIFGMLLIAWRLLNKTPFGPKWSKFVDTAEEFYDQGRRGLVVRWFLYIAMTIVMVVYIVVVVAKNTPENLRSLIGLFAFPVLLFLYSNKKKKINWHTVFWGMAIQFIMALLVLKTSWGGEVPQWVGDRLSELTAHGKKGSVFIFGASYQDHRFAFDSMVQAMVLIIGMSVLTYTGAVQFFVNNVGRPLAYCLRVSPAEGINTVSNIFLQMPESFLFIQEYIIDMAPSQLFIVYAGGLSTVGGVVLVIFMSLGIPAGPVIAASVMSAPASLAAAKLAFPTHKGEVTPKPDDKNGEAPSLLRKPTSLVDAIIIGIHQSIALIVTIVAYLLALIIIMEFCNKTLSWFGDRVGVADVTLEFLFSYFFYPVSYAMGVRADDCLFVGKLLGIRTFSFSMTAFAPLGVVIKNRAELARYEAESVNNTWSWIDDDIYLKHWNRTLINGVIEERSEVIAAYALCGAASVTILGFVIGSLSVLIPHRKKEITEHIFRALVVGTVASVLTACFAGLLFEEN